MATPVAITRADLPTEDKLRKTIASQFPPCTNASQDPFFPIFTCATGTRPVQINAPYSTVTCGCVSVSPTDPNNLWVGTGTDIPKWSAVTYFTDYDCLGDKKSNVCEVYQFTRNVVIKAIENVKTDDQYQAAKKILDQRVADPILNDQPNALSDAIQALYNETDPKILAEISVVLNQFNGNPVNYNVFVELTKLIWTRLAEMKYNIFAPENNIKINEKTFAEYKARVAKESADESLLAKTASTTTSNTGSNGATGATGSSGAIGVTGTSAGATGTSGATGSGATSTSDKDSTSKTTTSTERDTLVKQIESLKISQKMLQDQANVVKKIAASFPAGASFDGQRNAQNATAAAFQKNADDIQKSIDEKNAALKKIDDAASGAVTGSVAESASATGAAASAAAGSASGSADTKESSSFPWLYVGIGIGVLALIILIIVIAAAMSKKNTNPYGQQPSYPPQTMYGPQIIPYGRPF